MTVSVASLSCLLLAVGLAAGGRVDQYGRPANAKARRSLTSIVTKLASSTASSVLSHGDEDEDELADLPTSWDSFMQWAPPPPKQPVQVSPTSTSTTTAPPATLNSNDTSATSATSGGLCGPSGFMCAVHAEGLVAGTPAMTCLPLGWKCDNVVDCPDASDEQDCPPAYTGCPRNHLVCDSLLCVSATLRCDGMDDCGDGTDERDCPPVLPTERPTAPPPGCPDGRYACNKGPCVTLDAVCDGFTDCPRGDDEEHCAPSVVASARHTCAESKFRCHSSGDCIEAAWQCDGMNDCPDGSDELMCSGTDPIPSSDEYQESLIATCTSDQFKCLYGEPACVSRDSLCDGHCDCVDCGDEGGACGACEHFGCEYFCRDGPSGPRCWCPEGMMLNAADAKRCYDTNECLAGTDLCDQICFNMVSGYGCLCADGFDLQHDQHCVLHQPDAGSIVVLFNHEIRILPMTEAAAREGHAYNTLALSSPGFVCDAELAPYVDASGKQTLYYGAKKDGGTDGKVYVRRDSWACFLDNVVGLSSLAVDFITGNLYFTASAPAARPGVGACSPDAHCAMVFSDADMPFVRSLVLEPTRARMFWIDADLHRPAIRAALMDGSRMEAVVDTKLVLPTGLTIDTHRQNLYWGDTDLHMIERINLHTMKREVMLSRGVRYPNDMMFFDHSLFWTDTGLDAVLSVDVRNASAGRRLIKSFGHTPAAVSIAHPATEAQTFHGENPCAKSACLHLCLLTLHKEPSVAEDMSKDEAQLTATCACPDGYRFDPNEHVCRPDATLARHMQLVRMCADTAAHLCAADELCHNGGRCVLNTSAPDEHRHTCKCKAGFDGKYCEVVLHAAVVAARSSNWGTAMLCLLAVASALVCAICLAKRRRTSIYWAKPMASISSVSARVPSPRSLISWPQGGVRKRDVSAVSYSQGDDEVSAANVSRDALISGGSPGERVPLTFDNKLFQDGQRAYRATTTRNGDALSASGEHDGLLEQATVDAEVTLGYKDNDSGISGNDSAIINV